MSVHGHRLRSGSAGVSSALGVIVLVSLEHFFRHDYARVVAHLSRRFGVQHLDLIEDAVQDAMLTAVQTWQFGRVPDRPAAWVLVVARNRLLNALKRNSRLDEKLAELTRATESQPVAHEPPYESEAVLQDDFIRFLLLCCHPLLRREDQIALTLRLGFGFHTREIARAFVTPEKTLAQRLVRAKRKLKGAEAGTLSDADQMAERFDTVLATLSLVFNEGYHATRGDAFIRHELCLESIRVLRLIVNLEEFSTPAARALLALQLLQCARFPARTDDIGDLLTLEEQDRSLWDAALIEEGIAVLHSAAGGDHLSEYHLLATISALHNTAASFAETDWERITALYQKLYAIRTTPIVGLNYGISIAMSRGFAHGISFIEAIPDAARLEDYCLYHSTLGALYLENDESELARSSFLKARELTDQPSFRNFLDRKLSQLE